MPAVDMILIGIGIAKAAGVSINDANAVMRAYSGSARITCPLRKWLLETLTLNACGISSEILGGGSAAIAADAPIAAGQLRAQTSNETQDQRLRKHSEFAPSPG